MEMVCNETDVAEIELEVCTQGLALQHESLNVASPSRTL